MSTEPTFDPRRKAAIRNLVVSNAAANPGRAGGRKPTALVVALVLLAVSISGGGVAYALGTGLLDPKPVVAPTPVPTPTATPTATLTPTPTPTPTPTAAAPVQDPADLSTWVIGFDGVGPVKLGSALADASATVPVLTDQTDPICAAGQRALVASDGVTLVAESPGGAKIDDLDVGFNFTSQGDRVLATPRTAQGIGVGATLGDLMAAYPGIAQTGEYNGMSRYYGLEGGHGTWIVFGVLNGRIENIQVGPHSTIPSERCPA